MADDNLEQNTGGTFADDIGVEIEYAEVEDVSAEQFNKYIDTAAAELNPPLQRTQELSYEMEEPQDTMEFGEYLSFLGTLLNEQSGMMTLLGDKLERLSNKIDLIQEVMMDLTTSGVKAVIDVCTDEDLLDDMFGDEDLDDYEPKRKGTPGRPAKEAPKTAMPPKREKPKKTAVKKKVVAKVVAKKKVPAKKKAAKKKSKR